MFLSFIVNNGQIQSSTTLDAKMDWTEMNEMSSPNSGKRTTYERSGSKDSMQVNKKSLEITKIKGNLSMKFIKYAISNPSIQKTFQSNK